MPWKDDLSDENKANPSFKDIGDDINDLAKNFLDAQSHLGNAIRIPSKEASAEDITAFHNRLVEKVPGLIPTPDHENPESIDIFLNALGKPKDKDGYELPAVDGIEVSDIRAELIRNAALEQGLTTKQLNGFLTKMYEADLEISEDSELTRHQDSLNLKKEWGVTHENKMKSITDTMLLTEAPAPIVEALKSGEMGSEMIKWLDNIFSKFATEDNNLDNDNTLDEDDTVPLEAAERANEIRKKLMDPNTVKVGPEYEAMLAKLVKYEAMAHPGSSTDINDLRAGIRSK